MLQGNCEQPKMDQIFPAIGVGLSIAGVLVSIGFIYGITKSKQESTDKELSAIKKEITNLGREIKLLRRAGSKVCRFAPDCPRSEPPIVEFSPTESFEETSE